jgi:hypothetical protein
MNLRSCAGRFMSWKSPDLESRQVEPVYFDFVTYCGQGETGEAVAASEWVR